MKTTANNILATVATHIDNEVNARSAWNKAVKGDALDLIANVLEGYSPEDYETAEQLRACMLNGAETWERYSWGGCALVYNENIRAHYMTPSEQKRYKGDTICGAHLLDIQARALYQAAALVLRFFREELKK